MCYQTSEWPVTVYFAITLNKNHLGRFPKLQVQIGDGAASQKWNSMWYGPGTVAGGINSFVPQTELPQHQYF